MGNEPKSLTKDEIKEIAAIEDIRQMWGAKDAADMEDILGTMVNAAKFDFHSGSPGYVGDLYILQGDVLTGDPPLVLTRDRERQLVIQ